MKKRKEDGKEIEENENEGKTRSLDRNRYLFPPLHIVWNMKKGRRDDKRRTNSYLEFTTFIPTFIFSSDFSYDLSIPLRTISKLKPKLPRERETGSLERSMGSRLCLPVRPVPSSSGFICFRTKEDEWRFGPRDKGVDSLRSSGSIFEYFEFVPPWKMTVLFSTYENRFHSIYYRRVINIRLKTKNLPIFLYHLSNHLFKQISNSY